MATRRGPAVGVWGYLSPLLSLLVVLGPGGPSRSVHAGHGDAASWTVAMGRCWLPGTQLRFGQDNHARYFATYYTTRWQGQAVQTLISGGAPTARYWSLTLYPAQRGRVVAFYDHQLVSAGSQRTFRLVIGTRPATAPAVWVDPVAHGSDAQGLLVYRVYAPTGALPPLPTVVFQGRGTPPTTRYSCAQFTAGIGAMLAHSNTAHAPRTPTDQARQIQALWPKGDPAHIWSVASRVEPTSALGVPLYALGDPNDVYHMLLFDVTTQDVVLQGTLPPISPRAPQVGVRYVSLCAYPLSAGATFTTVACVDDHSIKLGAQRTYTVILSPDEPDAGVTWLRTGTTTKGVLVLRWLLPHGGAAARFCLPTATVRPPGDPAIPLLATSC